jgi:hypothetical protein
MIDPKKFTAAGFTVATSEAPKRLLINSQGLEKSGKTHWALSSLPDPIAFISLDNGFEGVIEKFADKKQIACFTTNVPPVAAQSEYLPIWNNVKSHIITAMGMSEFRSIVLDTGTDIWELLRLAEFGSLTPRGDIKQIYSIVNQQYRSLIKIAYDKAVSLDVIHRVKKQYVTRTVQTQKGPQKVDVWEGDYERAGFADSGYLSQINIEHIFDASRPGPLSNKFGIRVIDSRQNMNIVGLELFGEENNFPTLASYVFDNSPEDWA